MDSSLILDAVCNASKTLVAVGWVKGEGIGVEGDGGVETLDFDLFCYGSFVLLAHSALLELKQCFEV